MKINNYTNKKKMVNNYKSNKSFRKTKDLGNKLKFKERFILFIVKKKTNDS